MKKQEYIEKYGEEAWEKRKKANRAYMEKWHIENAEKERKYRLENAEMISKRSKKWREDNKEYVKERDKKYRELNPRTEYFKSYREVNKKVLAIKNNDYHKTQIGRAVLINNRYKAEDVKRGLDISNNITSEWIVNNIFSGQKCVYCGDQDWTHLGCDRIDNNKPHTPDNVVCSCGLCNIEKSDKFTVEEFKQYRSLHPRACDIPKTPAIQLSETGALKKRVIQVG